MSRDLFGVPGFFGVQKNKNEARGIRTPDNLIKSQVLYRLS